MAAVFASPKNKQKRREGDDVERKIGRCRYVVELDNKKTANVSTSAVLKGQKCERNIFLLRNKFQKVGVSCFRRAEVALKVTKEYLRCLLAL